MRISKAFRRAYHSIVLGGGGDRRTTQPWILVMVLPRAVSVDSYSLCAFAQWVVKGCCLNLLGSPWPMWCVHLALWHALFLLSQSLQKTTIDFWGHFTESNWESWKCWKFTVPGAVTVHDTTVQSPVTLTPCRTSSAVEFTSRAPAPDQAEVDIEPSRGCFPALPCFFYSHTNCPREHFLFSYNKLYYRVVFDLQKICR